LWALSSFSLVMTTLLGWMPTWTAVPLSFPTAPVHCRGRISSGKPELLCQSADLGSALARPELHCLVEAWMKHCASVSALWKDGKTVFLRMWDGAWKCLLWFLLWSEVTKGLNFILAVAASTMVQKGRGLSIASGSVLAPSDLVICRVLQTDSEKLDNLMCCHAPAT
jgi:hypothetical protein